jgi:hypothetical protein
MPLDTSTAERPPHNHEVYFYSDDQVLVETVTNFVAAALNAGNPCIAFATQSHRDSILQALKLQGVDVDAAIASRAFILLDAAEMLSMFMVNGWPDRVRFFEGFGKLVESVSKGANARIAIFGEGVALLCDEGNTEAALQLEQLGNHLTNKYDANILCAYPLRLCTMQYEREIKRICAQHSAVHSH